MTLFNLHKYPVLLGLAKHVYVASAGAHHRSIVLIWVRTNLRN